MNESSAQTALRLKRERARHRRRLVLVLISVPMLAMAVVAAYTATRGVSIEVAPPDAAEIATIMRKDGFGMLVDDTLYGLAGSVTIVVSAAGFYDAERSISPNVDGTYVEITLEEIPATVFGSTVPPHPETTWLIDGVKRAEGETLAIELEPGEYVVQADNRYFETVEQEVKLGRAEERSLEFELPEVDGLAHISTLPPGATVLIDGAPAGASNLDVPLKGGEYGIEVKLARHGTVQDRIRVTRDRNEVTRTYRLQSNPASLSIVVSPPGGKLLLNGRSVSAGQGAHSVSAGTEHVVSYELSGFHTRTARLTLQPGEQRSVSLSLEENRGIVRVRSEPAASVSVDGRELGETPFEIELPARPHTITVARDGYVSQTRTITPSSKAEQLIDVELLTELRHRLRNEPRRYVNTVGMEMLQFRPGAFEMGAPRGEPGARANERQHRVELTRTFYVSKTEVTNAQFHQGPFSGAATGPPKLPKANVSWEDAARFCNWLSRQEGREPVYRFNAGNRYLGADIRADGDRLPTEAEWEWLARQAGRNRQTRFTWGDDLPIPRLAGNLADESGKNSVAPAPYIPRYTDGFAELAPVGSFPVDKAGLADLTGNVREWVHDYYAILAPTAEGGIRDPAGPSSGEGHVVKGSGWRSGRLEQIRPAYRDNASGSANELDFRIARYLYGKE